MANAAAPLGAPAFVVALVAISTGDTRYLYGIFFSTSVISYFAFFLFGFPVLSSLRRLGRLTYRNVLITGACLGAGLDIAWPLVRSAVQGGQIQFNTSYIPLMTLAGFIIAALFNLVAGLYRKGSLER